jgi:type I restriction enzyme S subunit
MSSLIEYKLSDLMKIKYGKDHKHLADGKYPLYGSGGIMRFVEKPLYDGESILIPRKGTLGNLFYLNEPFWSVDTMFYSQIKQELVLPKYLFYTLKTCDLASLNVGSAVPSLTTEVLNEVLISIPPLPTQKAIAEILSSLDDKIELNNQINENLEALAQALFKQWFVDFEFPNQNGEPYKSSGGEMIDSELGEIPKDWKPSILKDEFKINMGQSPKGETYNEIGEGMIFFQGRTDFGFRFPSIRLFTTDPKKIARKGETLISVRAPVGDINRALEECCIGRGLGAIEEKNNHQFYTYYKILSIQTELKSYDNEGTVFGSINKDTLGGLKTIVPVLDLVERFDQLIKPIDDQIETLSKETESLKNLRDTLLPKLISGELEVNESLLEPTF